MTANAWAQLGVPLDQPPNAEAALKEALLANWNVRKTPLYAALPADSNGVSRTVEVRERVAVVRDNPVTAGRVDHLGIVSPTYPIIANEEQAELLDGMTDESGAVFYTAGELEAGRKVFVALRLPGHINVGSDAVECYVATLKSHDGTTPFTVLVTPVRVSTGAVLGSHKLAVRHSSTATDALGRLWLEDMFVYLDRFHQHAEQLADTPVTYGMFATTVERKYGAKPGSTKGATRAERFTAELLEMFEAANGTTAWDGFNVLASWYDYRSPRRGNTVRAQKALLDPRFKDKAFKLMMEAV